MKTTGIKKLVIVGPAYPLRGGIADFNESLCRAILNAGVDTEIVSFYLQYPGFLFPGKSQLSHTIPPQDIKVSSLISSVNPLSWFKAARYIIKQKPDVVVFRFWIPFMAPALGTIARLIRRKKIPVLAITDNIIPHEKRIGDHALTKYFLTACNGFMAMSKSVLNDVSLFVNTENKVFSPHPIYDIFGSAVSRERARQELKLSMNDKVVLFFGFIRQYKGLDLLLKAMCDERIKKMNIKLIVAGEFYEEEKDYTDIIEKGGITNQVILHTHFIDKESVKNYFCAANLVAQPYKSATQSGITQIAYHFEVPMIVTNTGGLSEIVPDGKTGYVTGIDSGEIADAIVRYFSEEKEEEFRINVREEKKRFSWEYFISNIANLMRKVNEGRK